MKILGIQNANTASFGSRQITLEQAQGLCTLVQNNFPCYSAYNLKCRYMEFLKQSPNKLPKFEMLRLAMSMKVNELRSFMRKARRDCDPVQYYELLAAKTHLGEVFNCGEHTELSYLTARINGIEDGDCKNVTPFSKRAALMDHLALCVKSGDEDFVIDSALGVADKTQNITGPFGVYSSKFRKYMLAEEDRALADNDYIESVCRVGEYLRRLNDGEATKLRELFPTLILDENNPALKKPVTKKLNLTELMAGLLTAKAEGTEGKEALKTLEQEYLRRKGRLSPTAEQKGVLA